MKKQLFPSLDLTDIIVTVDAIACELKNTDLIVSKGGHYVLALKKNNKFIHEQVSSRIQQTKGQLSCSEDIDFGSGRIETRTCYVENKLGLYDDLGSWKHLKSIIIVDSKREVSGKVSYKTRYYLSDLTLGADEFNKLIRNHWSIENKLHWKLDVVFNEDTQRTKSGNAPQNLTTLRKFALQLINQMDDKESIKNRRKMAGWNDNYLLKILQHL